MRMWMVPTETLCDEHLGLELLHIRTIIDMANRGVRLPVQDSCCITIEAKSLASRQQELRSAMASRELPALPRFELTPQGDASVTPFLDFEVDIAASWRDLENRCFECRRRSRLHGTALAAYFTRTRS